MILIFTVLPIIYYIIFYFVILLINNIIYINNITALLIAIILIPFAIKKTLLYFNKNIFKEKITFLMQIVWIIHIIVSIAFLATYNPTFYTDSFINGLGQLIFIFLFTGSLLNAIILTIAYFFERNNEHSKEIY